MAAALERLIRHDDDQILIIDIGDADHVDPRVERLGRAYEAMHREATIV